MKTKNLSITKGDDCNNLLLPEIWREILMKVDVVKSILRCTSVCKSWYSLVSCPDFISDYDLRNLNKSGNRLLLKLYDDIAGTRSYSSRDKSFTESQDRVDGPFGGRDLDIVGSCNGLICLAETWRGTEDLMAINFMIWNPTIRKIVELPPWNLSSRTQYHSCYGFGFDPKARDFKVLRVTGNDVLRNHYPNVVCEVFDLGKGIHWSATRRVDSRRLDLILLSFDMSDEVFREIEMPRCVESGESFTSTTSAAFGGLIYLLVMKGRNDDDDVDIDLGDRLSVWVMKEYGVSESWTKISNIDLMMNVRNLHCTNILAHTFHVWEKGEALLVHDVWVDNGEAFRNKRDFVLYDIGSGEIKCTFSTAQHVLSVCLYKESLMLL